MIPWKIQAILEKEYDHEIPDKPRSAEFGTAIKSWVNKIVKPYGASVAKISKGWKHTSGFIVWKDGLVTYFSIDMGEDEFLIRSAKDLNDYTGGPNHRCTFYQFEVEARRVVER